MTPDSATWALFSDEAQTWWEFAIAFFAAHLSTLVGFVLALLIMGRLVIEKRNPSNIFAWALIILFAPFIGVPLYFLFGGRKSRHLVANKRRVNSIAVQMAAGKTDPVPDPSKPSVVPLRKFGGNSFTLLGTGVAAFHALCAEIETASRSIHIMTYILGDDDAGKPVVELLTRRAREGVEVRLLVDALGSWGRARGRLCRPLIEAGGQVGNFMPVVPLQTKTSANLRNHRKFAIFDSRRAIVGGQNIDTRFMGPTPDSGRFLDFSAIVEGPVVSALNRTFVSDWCFTTKTDPMQFREVLSYLPTPAGECEMEIVSSGPDVEGDPLWERLIALVQNCRRELLIVTPYFVPDEVLFRSLIVKAHTGLPIRLILPERSNQAMVDFARHHYLRQLEAAGAQVLLYRPGMIHAKVFLADRSIALMGSANIDMRSLFVNFEIGVFHTSPEPLHALEGWVDEILPHCVPYAQTAHGRAGANRRLMEDFAHLLVPLL